MKSKYGFVALLDALGTRTASLEEATKYLELIGDIERDIKASLDATLDEKGIDRDFFNKLSIRFFGDTLLLTYEIRDREKEIQYFERISFVLQLFLCKALELGLLFRGSLSIGDYVDNKTVVLGPAVSDAASWYESLDMMGVILTPHATLALKALNIDETTGKVWVSDLDAFLERPPLSRTTGSPQLYLINWVYGVYSEAGEGFETEWFYKVMRSFRVPAGTESKFQNTEDFFLRHLMAGTRSIGPKGGRAVKKKRR